MNEQKLHPVQNDTDDKKSYYLYQQVTPPVNSKLDDLLKNLLN